MSDPNSNDRDPEQRRREHEDPFARSARHFDSHVSSLFNTLWGLPSSIYQRGNEHGREFNRMFEEHRREREEEQECEDGRGQKACGWRGRRHWERHHHQRREGGEKQSAENTSGEEDRDYEWIDQVAKTLERNEREAQNLYDEQKRMMDAVHQRVFNGDRDMQDHQEAAQRAGMVPKFPNWEELEDMMRNAEQTSSKTMRELESRFKKDLSKQVSPEAALEKKDAKSSSSPWSEIFPAWSNQTPPASSKEKISQEEPSKSPELRIGSMTITQQQAEEAFEKMQRDVREMMSGASQISRMLQDSYNRESRIFDEEGLFGASFPFSRPLSTVFSLGMRPFLPQDSAMAYLLFSEYSPLHLEHEEGFDASFRRRFEDLVALQSGREMGSGREEEGTKVEFLTRIIPLLKNEGSVRPALEIEAAQSVTGKAQYENEAYYGPETEQDLYEQHPATKRSCPTCSSCGKSFTRIGAYNSHKCSKNSSAQHTSSSPISGVLSTLTTTERHVDADGNITTKTVLKRHFADGREETETETHRETSPTAWARQRQLEAKSRFGQHEDKTAKETKRGGGGWFWSS